MRFFFVSESFICQLKSECRIFLRSDSLCKMFQYAITHASATLHNTNASEVFLRLLGDASDCFL